MGYAIAWERRSALLSVLVPVLIPAQLVLMVLRMLAAPEDITVINGELIVPTLDGLLGFAGAAIAVAAWLLGITAAIVVIGQPSVRTGEALKSAAKAFPAQALWAVAAVGVSVFAFLFAALLSWLGILLLVVLAFVLARLSLSLVSRALALPPSPPPRGRAFGASIRILLGAVVVPLLVVAGADRAGRWILEQLPSTTTGVAVHALGTLLLVTIVAVQAGTLAAVYLSLREEEVPPATTAGRSWILAASAMLLPALAIATITPSYGPQVLVRQGVLSTGAEEIVVVDDQLPVIFTSSGAYRCDDFACTGGTEDNSGVGRWDNTAVGVGDDGALLAVYWSRSGADVLSVTRCAPECTGHGAVGILESAAAKPLPVFGVASSADGTVWIALAQQPAGRSVIELSLIRCAATSCQDHQRIRVGTIDGILSRGEWQGDRYPVHMRLSPNGTPSVEFGFTELAIVTCDTPMCTNASLTRRANPLTGALTANGSPRAILINDRGTFMVTSESAPPEAGVNLRIGAPLPMRERLVLWVCDSLATCAEGRRIPLHVRQGAPVREVSLALLNDGTMLIAEGTTIVSLRP